MQCTKIFKDVEPFVSRVFTAQKNRWSMQRSQAIPILILFRQLLNIGL